MLKSVSQKSKSKDFARITPIVLFPAPGIPIKTIFFKNNTLYCINDIISLTTDQPTGKAYKTTIPPTKITTKAINANV